MKATKIENIIRRLIQESLSEITMQEDGNDKIRASIEWMRRNYAKANEELFNGVLGPCNFDYKPLGGRILGNFSIKPEPGMKLKCNNISRRMFLEDPWSGEREYINKGNFYDLCNPVITLNSNYSGLEKSLYTTLIHEMCHYYTYMNGFAPKQAHGREFREIGTLVSYYSNGEITIKRLATAEEMEGYEVNDEIKQQRDRREQNRKARAHYWIVLRNGDIRLLNTNSSETIQNVVKLAKMYNDTVLEITNPELIERLYDAGYKNMSRTYRYWPLTREDDILKDYASDLDNLDNQSTFKVYYK